MSIVVLPGAKVGFKSRIIKGQEQALANSRFRDDRKQVSF